MGNPITISLSKDIVTHQTLGDSIKELIEFSYNLYNRFIKSGNKITIICGGQTPAYYCLAMFNFKIFNKKLVDIVILPHSKGGITSEDQFIENKNYSERLKEKDIKLNENVIIIDGIQTGTGILSLESALLYTYPNIKIHKISINVNKGVSQIAVEEEFLLSSVSKFSDIFPRIVTAYYPRHFTDSARFINNFSKNYPEIKVEDTKCFKLNNNITDKIAHLKRERDKELNLIYQQTKYKNTYFTPNKLLNHDNKYIYQCPCCKCKTGTFLDQNFEKYSELFFHNYNCLNKLKIPIFN